MRLGAAGLRRAPSTTYALFVVLKGKPVNEWAMKAPPLTYMTRWIEKHTSSSFVVATCFFWEEGIGSSWILMLKP